MPDGTEARAQRPGSHETPTVAELQARSIERLARIVLYGALFLVAQTCAYVAVWAFATRDASYAWSALIPAVAVPILLGARAAVVKARIVAGVVTLSGCFLGVAIAGAALAPRLWVADLLLPLAALALALPYLDRRGSLRLSATAWLATLVILVLGHMSEHPGPALRSIPPDEFASTAGALALVFVLIHLFGLRLRDELAASESQRADIAAAHARLTELDRMKTAFVNNVAHELRTPLTPLKTNVWTLLQRRATTPPDCQRALDSIDRNVERLASVVESVVDTARLQDMSATFANDTLDLGALVREVADGARETAVASGAELRAEAEPDLVAVGDRKRIFQVVATLVGNAIKFTPAGGRVDVRARRAGDEIVVRVEDTGVGVTPEEQEQLFAPFVQFGDTMQRTRARLGLGLYTARMIAIRHGGRVWCESAGVGRGATFALALPALPPSEHVRAAAPAGRSSEPNGATPERTTLAA
ncbi:MAG: sensor histidine kinase [Thermoplasmatota archaeon]